MIPDRNTPGIALLYVVYLFCTACWDGIIRDGFGTLSAAAAGTSSDRLKTAYFVRHRFVEANRKTGIWGNDESSKCILVQ